MLPSLIDTSLFVNKDNNKLKSGQVHYQNKSLPTYEKISDDVYLIRTDHGSFKLHRKDLISTLKELRAVSHLPVGKLSDELAKKLASTTEVTRILHNNQALTDLVLKDIQDIFSDVKNPVPGTVCAFFLGCYNNTDYKVFKKEIGCNPRCAASLLKCEGDHFECTDTILVFSNHQFNKLNNHQTSHAYIYIEACDFDSFYQSEIDMLREAHIKTVTLIYSNKDGSYREVTSELTLEQLPCNHLHHNNTSNVNIAGVIVVVILVLILLFAVLYVYGKEKI